MLLSALTSNLPPEYLQNASSGLVIFCVIVLTLIAHIGSRILNSKISTVPAIIFAMCLTLLLLFIAQWGYHHYYQVAQPIFSHLLGYVTVMLAIPLASLNFDGIPLKKLAKIIALATTTGALFPMMLATGLSLSHETIMAFSSRSVTTPIGLNIAVLVNAPLAMVNLIIVVSGLMGAFAGKFLLKDVTDERAKGLALGLVAHAFGTVEAWQISPVAGRYAAFGLAINGIITAIWFPIVYLAWKSI